MPEQLTPPDAILFDVGGTLLAEERFDLRAGLRAVVLGDEKLVAAPAEAFQIAERAARDEHRELLLVDWLMQPERGVALGVDALAADASGTVHSEAIEDAIWREVVTLVPRDGAVALLRRLRDDGVAAAAVSNAAFSGRVLAGELERHGFGGLLRFVVSSGDVGRRKPDGLVFATALERLGTEASRTWFVGDTWSEDIIGALAAGLTAIWLRDSPVDLPSGSSVVHVRDWNELASLYATHRVH